MGTVEENKAVVRLFIDGINKGDLTNIENSTTADFIFHATDVGRDIDLELFKFVALGPSSLSETSYSIEDIVCEDNKVSIRAIRRGKHTGQYGEFQNIAPTGKSISVSQFMMFRLVDGKIAEIWSLMDWVRLYQQIGALPPTEEIGK
jgi:predicted ester cyclase